VSKESGMAAIGNSLEVVLSSHEERIRMAEQDAREFMAHIKAEEYRFQMISNQIAELGEQLTGSMTRLSGRVDNLVNDAAEHHKYLIGLNRDKEIRDGHRKRFNKFFWGALLAAVVAVATQIGDAVWELMNKKV
jgi:hypothetical protein